MNHDDDQSVKTTTRITPDSNINRIYSDMVDYDSYIYGDADATPEGTIETMTVYDPDSERYEDIYLSSVDEIVNCYAYSRKTGEQLEQVALSNVSKALTNSSQFIWLGLYDPSMQTIAKVQSAFDLHELAIEDAFADHQRAKVENYDNDTIFVVLRTAKLENNVIRYGTTAIFMGKNYLITIRNGPSNSYAPVREHCHRRPEKLRMGPIFVLHATLDFIVDNYMPITDRLGSYLREQERHIFTYEFNRSTLKNLYELKSQLVHMRAVILPVQDICSFFINHKKSDLVSPFSQAAKPYFRDVNDHLLHSLDAINGLNEMLSVVMNTYLAMVTMGQNEVVRKLAAWAGILAVPTAIAGIYGMNFDFMPELHWKFSYLIIMLFIGSLCSYLYYNFKRLGWL
jgi:magnesium transporter